VDPAGTGDDIRAAFARARAVPKREQLPFPRTPHTTYWQHPDLPDIYFVTEQDERGSGDAVLVTVIDARLLWGVPREFGAG
jgi:hypothetical protein